MRAEEGRGQSAIEYLTTYGWAILIIAIIVSVLYLYLAVPAQVVNNSCTFVNGAYCNDMIIGINTVTYQTSIAFLLTNSQQYPIENPVLTAQVNRVNSTRYACSPTFVLPGGSIICTVNLTVSTGVDRLLSGNLYLNATSCGLSKLQYTSTSKCINGTMQTYTGYFAGHVQPLIAIGSSIVLSAANSTQAANDNPDQLTATVSLLGYPLKGATVNFTASNYLYPIHPNLTTTNSKGIGLSAVYGTYPGTVTVNAQYAGLSNDVIIIFSAPEYVQFLPQNFTYCTNSGTAAFIDGVAYTCNQLSSRLFAYARGTSHSYQFLNPVQVFSNIREIYQHAKIMGIEYTSNTGTILVNSNLTIPISYYTQYYFGEYSDPVAAGAVDPGSSWYNGSAVVSISESPNSGYTFQDWSCNGISCYSGPLQSTKLTITGPVNETANYISQSTTSTTSTSTTSTSTSTTTTITQLYVWIVNYGSNTVTELSGSGASIGNVLGTYSTGTATYPESIVSTSSGDIWVLGYKYEYCTYSYTVCANVYYDPYAVELSGTGSQLAAVDLGYPITFPNYGYVALAVDPSGNVWSPYQENGASAIGVVAKFNSGGLIGTYPINDVGEPSGIAADGSGNVWVPYIGNAYVTNGLIELSSTGSILNKYAIETPSGNPNIPEEPYLDYIGINNSYMWSEFINGVTSDYVYYRLSSGSLGCSYTGTDVGPWAVAVDHNGDSWWALASGNVMEISPSCSLIGTYSTGISSSAVGITVDSLGDIWVTYPSENEVAALSSTGNLIGIYSSDLNSPDGVTVT